MEEDMKLYFGIDFLYWLLIMIFFEDYKAGMNSV